MWHAVSKETSKQTCLHIIWGDRQECKLLICLSKLAYGCTGPGYKYKEVVRKKSEREAMLGVECPECQGFYEACQTWNSMAPAELPKCGHAVQGKAIYCGSFDQYMWPAQSPCRPSAALLSHLTCALDTCLKHYPNMTSKHRSLGDSAAQACIKEAHTFLCAICRI